MITWDPQVSIFLFPFVSTDCSVFRVSSFTMIEKEDALMRDVVWCKRNGSSENINFPHSARYTVGLTTQQSQGTFHTLFLAWVGKEHNQPFLWSAALTEGLWREAGCELEQNTSVQAQAGLRRHSGSNIYDCCLHCCKTRTLPCHLLLQGFPEKL